MDGKTLVRIAAVIFGAIAITAAAVEMTRKEDKSGSAGPEAATQSQLREGIRHCQVLGEAALRDSDCLRLWAEQRDRFLGPKAPSASSTSEPVAPPSANANSPGAR